MSALNHETPWPCQLCNHQTEPGQESYAYLGRRGDLCQPPDRHCSTLKQPAHTDHIPVGLLGDLSDFFELDQDSTSFETPLETGGSISGQSCCNSAANKNDYNFEDRFGALFEGAGEIILLRASVEDDKIFETHVKPQSTQRAIRPEVVSAEKVGLGVGESWRPPCCLAFPICAMCAWLLPYYLRHRLQIRRDFAECGSHGYELLYRGLSARFLDMNTGINHPCSLYARPNSLDVAMLGRAIVLRTTYGDKNGQELDLPRDVGLPIRGITLWLMSKLKPLNKPNRSGSRVHRFDAGSTKIWQSNGLLEMPAELLERVVWDLDRVSVFAMRLTHPILANHLPLGQTFWCNELLYGDPPLFGFASSNPENMCVQPGLYTGRRDAISMFGDHYTRPKITSRILQAYQPSPKVGGDSTVRKRDWRKYDWKSLVRLLSRSSAFEDGEECNDAPLDFRSRRRLWGTLDHLLAAYA